jgi:hypothetical protein
MIKKMWTCEKCGNVNSDVLNIQCVQCNAEQDTPMQISFALVKDKIMEDRKKIMDGRKYTGVNKLQDLSQNQYIDNDKEILLRHRRYQRAYIRRRRQQCKKQTD